MLLKQLIDKGVETVSSAYPSTEAKEMVFTFLEHLAGIKRFTHIVEPGYDVSEDVAAESIRAFERMASGEPLQYIMGIAYFYGRDFHVTPDVLIPRPETEYLCRTVLERVPDAHRILDLCTGSGCIAWTLALEKPGAQVTAVDISDGALNVASTQDFSEEMSRTGAISPTFLKADVLGEIPDTIIDGYDLILSNPPYVMDKEKQQMRTNVLDHEPHLALFVPDEDPLLFYSAVARWSSRLLDKRGAVMVEINEALGEQTAEIFRKEGFKAEVIRDLYDKDRFVFAKFV